jgi:outer membrane protein OmpA-like peptidoglycan-associated protein
MRMTRANAWHGPSLPALASMLACAWLLQGCSSTPPAAPAAPPTAPTRPGASPPPSAAQKSSTLAIERQWLQSWFEGTPVLIVQRSETSLSVEVPREFSFDAGRSQVKPALAAVLDKVAESLRRKAQLRLEQVAAPGDAASASPLAQLRATQLRSYLVARGVPASRVGPPSVSTGAAVLLRMELAAP